VLKDITNDKIEKKILHKKQGKSQQKNQRKCNLSVLLKKFIFPQRPHILHYLQHSSSQALNQQKKLKKK
jgi:hypothetical protein